LSEGEYLVTGRNAVVIEYGTIHAADLE